MSTNIRMRNNRSAYYLGIISCCIFVLSEYCPWLQILDQFHLKHMLLIIYVGIFGRDLIVNRKHIYIKYEMKQIILAGSIFPNSTPKYVPRTHAGEATRTIPYIYAGLSFSGTDTVSPNISSVTNNTHNKSVKKWHFII